MTMYDKRLREIRLFLDSIPGDVDETGDSQYCFDLVEERAIDLLDSRFMEFEGGLLEEFLLQYLLLRRYEYLLVDMDCPEPVER
jgi:hypothetical protein